MEGYSEEPALHPAPSRAPDPPLPAPKRTTARRLGLAPPANPAVVRRASHPNPTGGASMGGEDSHVPKGRKRPPQHPTSRSGAVKPKKPAAQRVPSVEVDLNSPGSIESPSSSSPVALNPTPSTSPAFPVDCEQQVLGEMPASVDDETFMNIMDSVQFTNGMSPPLDDGTNESENFVVDDGSDVDVDFDDVPKKRGSRGVNFTLAEDETIVKAWQAITLDAITGDEQPGSTYWQRIYDHFCRHNMSGTTRSQVSVTHRWQTISAACTKWASCMVSVERLNPSGANAQDKVNIAQRLYKGRPKKKGGKQGKPGKPGKGFALHHCWVLLEHDEKWRTRNLEVPSKTKKSSNSCSPADDECVDIGSEDEDVDSAGRRSPTPTSAVEKRPPGRKQEKEKLKKGGENVYKESLDNMVATRKELAEERKDFKTTKWSEMKELEERRTLAEERRTEIEERRTATEERRTLAEERRAAAEERRAAIEERRVVAEEMAKRAEHEQRIMFMDPSKLDEKGRAYLELMRDGVLVAAARAAEGFNMGGFGGFGGNGSSSANGGADGSDH